LKGTTFDAEEVLDPVGCTMTRVAVMVVPLVVPSTRTGSPFLMALAEVELVPFRYVVEDASCTVTFWPADVDTVKPDLDTLPTVPVVPPAAGPDRALDPPFPAWAAPNAGGPDGALDPTCAVWAVRAPAVVLPEVALTIP
jgi:hypothetical protein